MTGPTVADTTETGRRERLSWRGPGGDRPDLPLPPRGLPLLHRGTMRKRWRYVGFYGDEVMLCAATVLIGPFHHTFWSLWDRQEGVVLEHTKLRPGRPEVAIEGTRTVELHPTYRALIDTMREVGFREIVEVIGESPQEIELYSDQTRRCVIGFK